MYILRARYGDISDTYFQITVSCNSQSIAAATKVFTHRRYKTNLTNGSCDFPSLATQNAHNEHCSNGRFQLKFTNSLVVTASFCQSLLINCAHHTKRKFKQTLKTQLLQSELNYGISVVGKCLRPTTSTGPWLQKILNAS